jgi:hypothetical protein
MKKNELVDIIRTIVKEEVNNALPQLLMEVLAEKITQNSDAILESKRPMASIPTKTTNFNVKFDGPIKQQTPQPMKMFAKNPILNQILNETVGGVPYEEASAPSAMDVIKTLPMETLNENKEMAAVANALSRDYSKLLKAVDAKATAKRPV